METAEDFMPTRILCEACGYEGLHKMRELLKQEVASCPRCHHAIDLKPLRADIDKEASRARIYKFTIRPPRI